MTDISRFNLALNVRDFIPHVKNASDGAKLFSHLQLKSPTHSRQAEYVVYSGGEFKTQSRKLLHIFVQDIIARRDELFAKADHDLKINMELWDTIMQVVTKEVAKEYRAYRLEGNKCLQ